MAVKKEASSDDLLLELANLRAKFELNEKVHACKLGGYEARMEEMEEEERSMRTNLRVRRETMGLFTQMAQFWREQQVSVPNKPVLVPRSLLVKKTEAICEEEEEIEKTPIDLIRNQSKSSTDTASTSSHGSFKKLNKPHTTTTKSVGGSDCTGGSDSDCGSVDAEAAFEADACVVVF